MSPICRGGKGAWGSIVCKLWLTYSQRALQGSAARGEYRSLVWEEV